MFSCRSRWSYGLSGQNQDKNSPTVIDIPSRVPFCRTVGGNIYCLGVGEVHV